jgi:hypothetical protein
MEKKNNSEDWVTQKEAADKAGRSLASVNNLVKRGRIASKELYGKTLVSLSEVLSYAVSAGRPPKPKDEAEKSVAKKRIRKKDPTRLLKTLS